MGFGHLLIRLLKALGKLWKRLFLQETPHRKEQEKILFKVSLAWNPQFVSHQC